MKYGYDIVSLFVKSVQPNSILRLGNQSTTLGKDHSEIKLFLDFLIKKK